MKNKLKNKSPKKQIKRVTEIIRRLKKTYANAKIALHYSNNWELLIAVILSAQCTDKKVNEVTALLFKKYLTLDDYVSADSREFEQDIRSAGFYRAKANNILASAKIIKEKFSGKLPRIMEELLTLKGVARKTANVVLGNAYGVVEGIAVDTHVRRLSQRLGLSKHNDPVKIEQDLMAQIPKKEWFTLTYRLIDHGRAVCTARNPKCDICPLNDVCPSAFKFPRFKTRRASTPDVKRKNTRCLGFGSAPTNYRQNYYFTV